MKRDDGLHHRSLTLSKEKAVNHLSNLASGTPRKRSSETIKFNGVSVKVAAPVLRKWDEISEEEKVAFQRAADEAVMRRLTAKPWRHEGHLYKSIDAAERALEHLFKVNRTPHDRGETISSRPEQDPDKLDEIKHCQLGSNGREDVVDNRTQQFHSGMTVSHFSSVRNVPRIVEKAVGGLASQNRFTLNHRIGFSSGGRNAVAGSKTSEDRIFSTLAPIV